MINSRQTDEMYIMTYNAKDYYEREVVSVRIDFLFKTIVADIFLFDDDWEVYIE